MGRIAFDMDGTIVGFDREGNLRMRPGIDRVLVKLRSQNHTLILWTFGNRPWWRKVRSQFPILGRVFHEAYTRDDISPKVTTGRGYPEPIKDIRLINADVLVDNEPAHYEWAKRHGLAHRYVKVESFGVA